jgi:hypothetical protein
MDRPPEERIYDVDSEGNPVERQEIRLIAANTSDQLREPDSLIFEDSRIGKEPVPEPIPSVPEKTQEKKMSLSDLFAGADEELPKIPEETSESIGLWPGELYAVRQQYLYDMNEIMDASDVGKKSGGMNP